MVYVVAAAVLVGGGTEAPFVAVAGIVGIAVAVVVGIPVLVAGIAVAVDLLVLAPVVETKVGDVVYEVLCSKDQWLPPRCSEEEARSATHYSWKRTIRGGCFCWRFVEISDEVAAMGHGDPELEWSVNLISSSFSNPRSIVRAVVKLRFWTRAFAAVALVAPAPEDPA